MSIERIDGKRVVITGATSGIGRAATLELARRGADLTIVCRNQAKGEAVKGEISAIAPGADVGIVNCDLAELDSVRAAAAAVRELHARIDVLIDNAGVHATVPRTTSDGFDQMLASNYLGPFLFTNLLLESVKAAAPSRIVVVGSEAHRFALGLDAERFEDPAKWNYNQFTSNPPYGRTKLLDMLFAKELARRLEGTGVTVNSLCPGAVGTSLFVDAPVVTRLARIASRSPLIRTPEQGAKMTVRLATDGSLDGVTGRFFSSTPGASRLPAMPAMRDTALQARVWERTAGLVGLP